MLVLLLADGVGLRCVWELSSTFEALGVDDESMHREYETNDSEKMRTGLEEKITLTTCVVYYLVPTRSIMTMVVVVSISTFASINYLTNYPYGFTLNNGLLFFLT